MNFQPHISSGMPTAPATIAAGIEGKMRIGLTIIRRHRAVYFLPFRGRSAQKAAWRELCRIISALGKRNDFARDSFKFKKGCQLFVGPHNETLSVAAMCICNKDCSPVGINR
jgi:hypothetical protein